MEREITAVGCKWGGKLKGIKEETRKIGRLYLGAEKGQERMRGCRV